MTLDAPNYFKNPESLLKNIAVGNYRILEIKNFGKDARRKINWRSVSLILENLEYGSNIYQINMKWEFGNFQLKELEQLKDIFMFAGN